MITQELMKTVMQERLREADELRRQHEALAIKEQGATPDGGLSRQRSRRLPLLSFVANVFRTASAP